MEPKIKVSKLSEGNRNLTVHVRGLISEPMEEFSVKLVEGGRRPKIASLYWLVQEKLGLYFRWSKEELPIPMESRNGIRFDPGLLAPEQWDGTVYLSTFNWDLPPVTDSKAFLLVLDFDL
jgi:hypothetical protein